MSEQLKPCPFCGGEATISIMSYGNVVLCENYSLARCPQKVVYEDMGVTPAIKAWNTRTSNDKGKQND